MKAEEFGGLIRMINGAANTSCHNATDPSAQWRRDIWEACESLDAYRRELEDAEKEAATEDHLKAEHTLPGFIAAHAAEHRRLEKRVGQCYSHIDLLRSEKADDRLDKLESRLKALESTVKDIHVDIRTHSQACHESYTYEQDERQKQIADYAKRLATLESRIGTGAAPAGVTPEDHAATFKRLDELGETEGREDDAEVVTDPGDVPELEAALRELYNVQTYVSVESLNKAIVERWHNANDCAKAVLKRRGA